MLEKLQTLLNILRERVQHIDRWEKVGIYFPGDSFPKETVDEKDIVPGRFYVLWYSPRRKNSPNPYEYKEIPLTVEDIDSMLKRQREKLRTESENV